MYTLLVKGSTQKSVTAEIIRRIRSAEKNGLSIFLTNEICDDMNPDIIVITPEDISSSFLCLKQKCKILLLPGAKSIPNIQSAYVATYGMSPKDSITLSSVGEYDCILTLQRELVTIDGVVLERQDIPIQKTVPISPECLMAAVGCTLSLGIPPENHK